MEVQCCSYWSLFLSPNENIKKATATSHLNFSNSHLTLFFLQLPIYISQFRHLYIRTISISQEFISHNYLKIGRYENEPEKSFNCEFITEYYKI